MLRKDKEMRLGEQAVLGNLTGNSSHNVIDVWFDRAAFLNWSSFAFMELLLACQRRKRA
jgi:hypothetical protein